MYIRLLKTPKQSFFLLGPRGVGKSSWLKSNFQDAMYVDLLDSSYYTHLLANPKRIENIIPKHHKGWVLIDEIQKIPMLLNEVHRLIEKRKLYFALTGSSSRSLRKKGVNLLGGRALTYNMFPLTACELAKDFNLKRALEFGTLPLSIQSDDPKKFLQSYLQTYLREEVMQEGLIRQLSSFARFLETASFSQGGVINHSEIAREANVNRKTVEGYFTILEDLMLCKLVPVFTKRAKREMINKCKFYFFDAGVFNTIRPKGPLDIASELTGPSLETLVLNELSALNHYGNGDYSIYYWRTKQKQEVDFILYGPKGFWALEVKSSSKVRDSDLTGLRLFLKDYPQAKGVCVYAGDEMIQSENIEFLPINQFFNSAGVKFFNGHLKGLSTI